MFGLNSFASSPFASTGASTIPSVLVEVTGVQAVGQVGTVQVIYPVQNIVVTGLQAVGQVGTVIGLGSQIVYLTGVQAQGISVQVLVWGQIPFVPDAYWIDIDDSGNDVWVQIADSATQTWADIDDSGTSGWGQVDDNAVTEWDLIAA